LTDLKVRQAINKAIDRQAIATNLYGPTGVANCNILVVPTAVDSKNTTCERDVEGAKKLLDEAGWLDVGGKRTKDGKTMSLYFQTSINALRQGEQAIVKANLAEVGIAVNLKAVDAGVFFSGDPGNDDTLNKMYVDIQMYTNGPSGTDSQAYLEGWTCAKVNSAEGSWNQGNDGRYCNKAYDELFAKYAAETDVAKRTEMAIQLNDFLINDVAVIPLINRRTPNAKIIGLNGPTHNTFDSGLWNIHEWSK
jgi:peptide/nickel transport system substrate-binding protein